MPKSIEQGHMETGKQGNMETWKQRNRETGKQKQLQKTHSYSFQTVL